MQNTSVTVPDSVILHGQFLSNHTSSLNAFWVNPPTPWPYLLINTLISIVLAYNGFIASSRSWHPTHHVRVATTEQEVDEPTLTKPTIFLTLKKLVTPSAFIEESTRDRGEILETLQTLQHRRRASLDDPTAQRPIPPSNLLNDNIQSAFLRSYAATGDTYDPADDLRPDGGMGRFTMVRTIFGACLTSFRILAVFALCVRIARGESRGTYPDPASVLILLCSAQMYLANRAMPRIFNSLIAIAIYLVFTAFLLIMFGAHSGTNYPGKAGVRGGECPYVSHWHCNSSSFLDWGCGAARSPWDTTGMGFPPNPIWVSDSGRSPDPNPIGLNTNNIYFWNASGFMKGVGLLYGSFAILFALPLVLIGCCGTRVRNLHEPLPVLKTAILGKMYFVMARYAFVFMILLSIVTFSVYIADEIHSPKFLYVDSFGPLINGSSFKREASLQEMNLTALINGKQKFIGGNSTSWSDCFEVPIPSLGKWGGMAQWWRGLEETVLRVMALV